MDWTAWTALPSLLVWSSVVVLQLARDRYRTWTEIFLLGACASVTLFALADLLGRVLWPSSVPTIQADIGGPALAVAAACFVLFAAALQGRIRRMRFVVFVPALSLAAFTASGAPKALGLGDPVMFGLWIAFIDAYGLAGCYLLYRTYATMRRAVRMPTRHITGFMVAAVAGTGLWMGLTVLGAVLTASRYLLVPVFCNFAALLVAPGAVVLVSSLPGAQADLLGALRRSRTYGIRAAFLLHKDGVLLDSLDLSKQVAVDKDLFGATLDIVQNFMRTAFPALGATGLKSVDVGDQTLLIERGKYASLVLVLSGKEDDALRRFLKDMLREFESKNADVLADWKGDVSAVKGSSEILALLVTMA